MSTDNELFEEDVPKTPKQVEVPVEFIRCVCCGKYPITGYYCLCCPDRPANKKHVENHDIEC